MKKKIAVLVVCIMFVLQSTVVYAAEIPSELRVDVEPVNTTTGECLVRLGTDYTLGWYYSNPLVIYSSKDILGIRMNDEVCEDFFTRYAVDEYWASFAEFKGIEATKYSNIKVDDIASGFIKLAGGEPEGYVKETISTYLRDWFLIAALTKTVQSQDLVSKGTSYLDKLNEDYEPGKLFYQALWNSDSMFLNCSSIKEIRDLVERVSNSMKKELTVAEEDKIIYERYVKDISIKDLTDYSYESAEKVLYALTWDNLTSYPQFDIIRNGLGVVTRDRQELLEGYWKNLLDNYEISVHTQDVLSDDLIQLSSIIGGRSSTNSMANDRAWSPFRGKIELSSEVSVDENAKINADQMATLAINMINGSDRNISETKKQLFTISYRMQYHYYAMQGGVSRIEGVEALDMLSVTESANPFVRTFAPLDVSGSGIIGQSEYIKFMNTVNEIPLIRQTLIDITEPDIEKARQLIQLKGAVDFLNSLPYSDISKITDYWYEKDSRGEQSLEDLYQKALAMDLDGELLLNELTASDKRPLDSYFNLNGDLSLYIKLGIAQSSLFTPLQTNVYEPMSYSSIKNDKFLTDYHSVWGYNRKALYIDTSLASAVNLHNTGRAGPLKPATLKDILSSEKDIVLYTDTAFYNSNKLGTLEDQARRLYENTKEKVEALPEDIYKTLNKGKWHEAIRLKVGSALDLVMDKSSDFVTSVCRAVTPYGLTLAEDWEMDLKKNPMDDSVFNGNQIKEYLVKKEYSELKTFAVQSAILRDIDLAEYIVKNNKRPVFISSKNLCLLKNVTQRERSSFYNYLLLKNIEPNIKVEYKSTMDYNSFVYMDVYGNIVTESGYVVVPAAANATLQEPYNPYTTAFIGSYGKVLKAPKKYKAVMEDLSELIELNSDETEYEFRSVVEGGVINFQHFSKNSNATQERLYNIACAAIEGKNIDTDRYIVNVLIEVMRGAPIEYIDKEAEGLSESENISKAGVVQAAKLDNLKVALKTGNNNSVVAIPNLAFASGIEYIILFVFKIVMLAVIILIFVQIFTMAMTGSINLFSIVKIMLTVVITFALVFTVPVIYETTYYQINKAMLQNETLYIAMLNLEKSENGIEIGMQDITDPEIDTKLFLKMEDINLPWTRLFSEVITAPVDSNLSRIYSQYAESSMTYNLQDFQAKGDAIYLDVDDLFNTSSVMFDANLQTIYHYVKEDAPASFYSPYYVFLDSLVRDINIFNAENQVYNYTTTMQKGGRIKCVGLMKEFLTSDSFMMNKDEDNLHLRQIYGLDTSSAVESPFTTEDVALMQRSYWCNTDITGTEVNKRISKLNSKAMQFVNENKSLIGRISDETFLKCMALDLAMYHNKLFGVDSAQSLELYNLSPDDLIRLSIMPKEAVMKGSIYSYSRFVFENSGTVGVYTAAILDMLLFVSGWVKPALTILLFLVLYLSIFINRLVLRRDSDNLKGYIRLVLLLAGTNLLYCLTLKLSTMLPKLGLTPVVCMLGLIVFHSVFIGIFVWAITTATLSWRDLGNSRFESAQFEVKEFITGSAVVKRIEEHRDNPTNKGWEFYNLMHNEDKQRVYKLEREDEI